MIRKVSVVGVETIIEADDGLVTLSNSENIILIVCGDNVVRSSALSIVMKNVGECVMDVVVSNGSKVSTYHVLPYGNKTIKLQAVT